MFFSDDYRAEFDDIFIRRRLPASPTIYVCAQDRADDPAAQLEMVKLLAAASGSRGMAGGQAIDLDAVGKQLSVPELEFMHVHKTGAIIRASVLLGARQAVTVLSAPPVVGKLRALRCR